MRTTFAFMLTLALFLEAPVLSAPEKNEPMTQRGGEHERLGRDDREKPERDDREKPERDEHEKPGRDEHENPGRDEHDSDEHHSDEHRSDEHHAMVCHRIGRSGHRTLEVSHFELPEHIKHGDHTGACAASPSY